MKCLVFVLEDNGPMSDKIKARLDGAFEVETYEWPWELFTALESKNRSIQDYRDTVVIADLYGFNYWELREKQPPPLPETPSRRERDNAIGVYKGALDAIENYLKVMREKYGLRFIIYSHVMTYLRDEKHQADWAEHVRAELSRFVEHIVDKQLLKDSTDEEIDRLTNLIRTLTTHHPDGKVQLSSEQENGHLEAKSKSSQEGRDTH